MALSPSGISKYNGQSASFSCPYVENAVQWEWWSDNPSYASVSPSGQSATVSFSNWTAGDVGGITIYCNAKNEFNQTIAQHNAVVTSMTCPATGMSVSPGSMSLSYDNQFGYMTGTLTSNQGGGAQVSLPAVNYASENTAICAVGSSGLLNAEGNGTILVWVGGNAYPGIAGYCQVTVTGFPIRLTSLTANNTPLSIQQNGSAQLSYTKNPSNANEVINFSTNGIGCSVNSSGLLTVGSTLGGFTCTATGADSGVSTSWSCTVTSANIPVNGVTLNITSKQIAPGGQFTLTPTVSPSNATNKSVSWSTGNSSVATVSNGVVTAVAVGICNIVVTTVDGGYQALCTVTVSTVRPANFAYTYAKTSGGAVYSTSVIDGIITAYIMPATEWNALTARINEFRLYKSLASYGFTAVSSGTDFTPAIYNQAVNAINAMGFSLSTTSSGNISAAMLNSLVTTINSIV